MPSSSLSWRVRATRRTGRKRRLVCRPCVEPLEDRTMPSPLGVPILPEAEPNNAPYLAMPIPPSAVVLGSVSSPGEVDYYAFSITQPGALAASVVPRNGSSLAPQLELDGVPSYLILNNVRVGGGGQIAFSAGSAPGNTDPLIQQFLRPGPYELAVSAAPGSPAGDYTLAVDFQPEPDPSADPVNVPQPGVALVNNPLFPGIYSPVANQPAVATGPNPVAVIAADLNGDGVPDLVTANPTVREVFVLLANGDGSFQPAIAYPVPDPPTNVIAVDFHNDGRMDLATVDSSGQWVTILPGLGDGTFSEQELLRLPVSDPRIANNPSFDALLQAPPPPIARGDFNRDGTFDTAQLVPLLSDSGAPVVPPANAAGVLVELTYPATQGAIDYPPVTDPLFHGPLDVTPLVSEVQINPSFDPSVAPHLATPLIGDLNGDGVPDIVLVSASGDILFRAGKASPAGTFAPSQLVNGPADPRARAAVLLLNEPQPEIAAIDLGQPTVSIYRLSAGQWVRSQVLSTPPFAIRMAVGDLDGSGQDDLVVDNTLLGTPAIYLARPDGSLGKPGAMPNDPRQPDLVIDLNNTDSDVALADLTGNGRLDLLATDPTTGDVTVALNEGLPPGQVGFTSFSRFYAGPIVDANGNLVYGTLDSTVDDITNANLNAEFAAQGLTPGLLAQILGLPLYNGELFPPLYFGFSNLQTSSVAAADFNGDGSTDLVVTNAGADNFTIIDGTGKGTFFNPGAGQVFDVGSEPTSVVAVPLVDTNGDGKIDGKDAPDVALLDSGTGDVRVYLNDGKSAFRLSFSMNVGTDATGLAFADINGDGIPDLLVGDTFGDVLVLLGKGDGTFQPPPSLTGDRVPLAVEDLHGNGTPDVLLANQQANTVMIQAPTVGPAFGPIGQPLSAADPASQLAPGAVAWFQLDHNSDLYDAVVMASGSNSLLVYRATGFDGSGAPTFAVPVSYATGTDPVSVTITDINGDGVPDMLVSNEGSNDVSVLLGSFDTVGHWVGTPGPRLKSGGLGPIAVNVINDPNSPGGHDLAITNGLSGTLAVLPGRGQGFFDDRGPLVMSLGSPIMQPPSVAPDGTGIAVTSSGQLLGFDVNDLEAGVRVISPPGEDVLAAQQLDNGDVLAAQAGGSVAMLTPGPNGLEMAGTLAPLTGVPLAASALDAIQTPTGMQVLVTSAGLDTIYVFGLPSIVPIVPPNGIAIDGFTAVPAPIPLPAGEGPTTLVATSSSLSEAPLVLTVILMTPSLTETTTSGSPAVVNGLANVVNGLANLRANPATTVVNASATVGGDEDDGRSLAREDGAAGPTGPAKPARGPALRRQLEKALEQLDLFRPLENRPSPGLQSRLETPWPEEGWDRGLFGYSPLVPPGAEMNAPSVENGADFSQPLDASTQPFALSSCVHSPEQPADISDPPSARAGEAHGQPIVASATTWPSWRPVFQALLAVLAAGGLGRCANEHLTERRPTRCPARTRSRR